MNTNTKPKSIKDAGFLAACLIRANEAAINAADGDDGGTCNLDTPIVHLGRTSPKIIAEAEKLSGIRLGHRMDGPWHRGYRFVFVETGGQAERRSRSCRAAYESLKNDGLFASEWLHAD